MSGVQTQMIRGVVWNVVQKYSSMLVTLFVTMIMARILSPEDFGVVAIALVVIAFLNIFSTLGIGPAIIQRKDLTQKDLNDIFSFSVYLGTILSVLLFVASWPIAFFFQNDLLRPICQLLCINVFFATINMVPTALMLKFKRFKEMAVCSLILSLISAVLSLMAVWSSMGLYSLLVNPIITAIGLFFFNFYYYPSLFCASFSFSPLKKIASYSVYQFAFQFVGFFSSCLDKLIIGKFFPAALLGYYDKAHNLTKYPMSMLTSVVTPILHPFLSDFQTEIFKIKEGHNMMTKLLSTLSLPLTVMLWFCGSELIIIFYGNQWNCAIFTFQIFTLSIPPTLIMATSGAFWQSTNSTKLLFWTGLTNSLIIVAGYIITSVVYGTIEAIAWGYVFTTAIIFFITYSVMYRYVFKTSLTEMLILLINPCVNAVILCGIYILFDTMLFCHNILLSLTLKVFVGGSITLLFIQFTHRYDIIRMIKEKRMIF